MSYADSRRSLHAVAETLLAGPQYRRSGTIRLQPLPGGFGTITEPDVRVEGGYLVYADLRQPIDGVSLRDLGVSVGLEAGTPADVYSDGTGATIDEILRVDPTDAATIAKAYMRGDTALRELAPGTTPVLWPEHFDLGVTVDEINYGVSPGDGYLDEPYAYVGPRTPRTGDFWNAPFGAARSLAELVGGDLNSSDGLREFFDEGRRLAGQ